MTTFRLMPVDRLRPAPYNPRVPLRPGTPAWERLERSLNEFSLVQPIVWNERTGHVVAGHQRLEILKHQGRTQVDCVVVDLPLEREKALNVALNNANVGSDWDPELLVDLLHELNELPDFDATLTGFDDSDLRDLLLKPVDDLPPQPEDDERDGVHVALVVPVDRWDDIRPALDDFLRQHRLTPHIRLPEADARNASSNRR